MIEVVSLGPGFKLCGSKSVKLFSSESFVPLSRLLKFNLWERHRALKVQFRWWSVFQRPQYIVFLMLQKTMIIIIKAWWVYNWQTNRKIHPSQSAKWNSQLVRREVFNKKMATFRTFSKLVYNENSARKFLKVSCGIHVRYRATVNYYMTFFGQRWDKFLRRDKVQRGWYIIHVWWQWWWRWCLGDSVGNGGDATLGLIEWEFQLISSVLFKGGTLKN